FFYDTATTEIYTLSLHDALPISQEGKCTHMTRGIVHLHTNDFSFEPRSRAQHLQAHAPEWRKRKRRASHRGQRIEPPANRCERRDRKSTRLNSSHVEISYAVFCL